MATGQQNDAGKNLLQEGFRSYLKAVAAVTAFEQEVQKGCRRVYLNNIENYASAIGLPLKEEDVQEFIWPKMHVWEGYRSIGVSIHRKQVSQSLGWWNGSCSLYWEEGINKVCCWVGDSLPKRLGKVVFEKLQKFAEPDDEMSEEVGEVGLSRMLGAEEAEAFEDVLDELFQRWVELWRLAGGIKSVLKGR